jgi:methyl-accepting chemotaxis protein
MRSKGITAKIWLSIGVFVLGFVFNTALSFLQGVETEHKLTLTAAALFPAAQKSQDAENAFQRMVKGFGDAVIMQDQSALDRAAEDGRQSAAALNAIAQIPALPAQRVQAVSAAARNLDQLLADARQTYSGFLGAGAAGMTPDLQDKMRSMAARTEETKAALAGFTEQFSTDLRQELSTSTANSAQHRVISVSVFFATLLLAGIIVHLTIQKSITGPVRRVITGVQGATDEAAEASEQMAHSGASVARDAQEQAACIQETSASLEEVSATAKQNADRAGAANGMMRDAHIAMEQALRAMNELDSSMQTIAKSSNQVAGVLKSIDEIAFQTNILALNAAVEAARAGQSGAGFSVVADEVRSLAHRAAEAARNSSDIVERTIRDVGAGVKLVGAANASFLEVSSKISGGTDVVNQITVSSEEQARGVANIGQAISRMQKMTLQNAADARQAASAASAMTAQVVRTRDFVENLVQLVGAGETK